LNLGLSFHVIHWNDQTHMLLFTLMKQTRQDRLMNWLKGPDGRAVTVLVVLFLLTRFFLFTGFPFNMNFLDMGMQILDPVDLEGNLLNSLLYQHTQPPLFNAFIGIVLKLTPDRQSAHYIFSFIYAAIGIFLVLGIYYLGVAMGAARIWAFTASLLFVFWPPNTWEHLFNHPPSEKWLSYDYPVTALILLMALVLVKYRDKVNVKYIVFFMMASAAIALVRPMFHLVLWVLPTLGFALWMVLKKDPKHVRMTVFLAVLLLLIAAWPSVKNRILAGWFTGSTFQGMNLASRTLFVPQEEVKRLVDEGKVTNIALIPRFSEPALYLKYYDEERKTGIAMLDVPVKSTGHPNFNHFITIRASQEYQRNTIALVAERPLDTVRALVNGVYIFFGIEPNQYLWKMDLIPWGFWKVRFEPLRPKGLLWPFRYVVGPLLFAVIYFGVIVLMIREREDPTCTFIAFALIYMFALTTAVELGHNNIFRKQIDPLLFAGAALLMTKLWLRFRLDK